MSGSAGALVTTDKFADLEHAIIACKAAGTRLINLLEVDVSTLDDDDAKRAKLAGALLVTKAGQKLAVPHTSHLSSRLGILHNTVNVTVERC